MATKQIAYFRIFREVSRAILSVLDSKQVLNLMVKRIVPAMKLKAASLRLLNEKTKDLELVASHLLSTKYLSKGPLNADKSVPEVLEGKPVLIVDAQSDPRIQYPKEKAEEGIASILSIPVQIHNKVIGMLRLYTSAPRSFSGEEIEFVSALGEMAGLAIINARMYEKEKEKLTRLFEKGGIVSAHQEEIERYGIKAVSRGTIDTKRSTEFFKILHEVSRDLLYDLNSREVLDSMAEKVIQIMHIKGCCIYLLNETTGKLEMVASRGLSNEYLQKGPIVAVKSMPDVLRGTTVFIKDVAATENLQYRDEAIKEGIVSILSVPIFVKEYVIGEIRLYSAKEREYDKEEAEFILALAEIGGIAITNTKFYRRLKSDIKFWESTLSYLDRG
ncbi:MAG: GAF domain-containing protein [Deltaproteobacteria bacterium]|nr:MAG: GAF domain-containing protein [Deltaproteobacteria bacterium]